MKKITDSCNSNYWKVLWTQTGISDKILIIHLLNTQQFCQFCVYGCNDAPPPGHGPYCIRIHGQIYHNTFPLHPQPGKTPQHGQLYILEAREATPLPPTRPHSRWSLRSYALDLHPALRHRRKICLKDERSIFLHKLATPFALLWRNEGALT